MSTLRTIALFVLAVSLLTFIAFFGRLPAFRKTPISFLHRLLWIHIPSGFRAVDQRFTNGRMSRALERTSHYLLYEPHPIVMVFFLGLVTVSAVAILSKTYFSLSVFPHRVVIPPLLVLPYFLTYLASASNPSNASQIVTSATLSRHLRAYPYDYILYAPRRLCETCRLPKPARSKHCRICNVCVARSDHHCVWVNNCVGKANLRWFLLLLLSMTAICLYGAVIAWTTVKPEVAARMEGIRRHRLRAHLLEHSTDNSGMIGAMLAWVEKFNLGLGIAVKVGGIRVTGVGLLAALTWPLPLGLLVYHIYLIWAGTTTNETGKWADWRDDMHDGVVFLGKRKGPPNSRKTIGNRMNERKDETASISTRGGPNGTQQKADQDDDCGEDWPTRSHHLLIHTADGQFPRNLPPQLASVVDEVSWQRCWLLAEVENIYDLGFWDNLVDAIQA